MISLDGKDMNSREYVDERVSTKRSRLSKYQLQFDIVNHLCEDGNRRTTDLLYLECKIEMYNRQLEKWVNHISVKG